MKWDGTRRVGALRDLGKPGSTKISAVVTSGIAADSVIAQVNINQARERLTDMAEAEALRQLVEEYKWQQGDAANKLLKSKSWASKVMRVWLLPKEILKDLRKGLIPLSHAIIMSRYLDDPPIMRMLHKESVKGGVASSHLAAMGKAAKTGGVVQGKGETEAS